VDQRRFEFLNADAVNVVLGEFQREADQEGVAILAHCFMPDHVHLLIETLRESCPLQHVARLMKSRAGFYFKSLLKNSGPRNDSRRCTLIWSVGEIGGRVVALTIGS
jgi:REP element-mobilizing transposase RayT